METQFPTKWAARRTGKATPVLPCLTKALDPNRGHFLLARGRRITIAERARAVGVPHRSVAWESDKVACQLIGNIMVASVLCPSLITQAMKMIKDLPFKLGMTRGCSARPNNMCAETRQRNADGTEGTNRITETRCTQQAHGHLA